MLDIVTTREPAVARRSGSSRAVRAKWPRWLTPMCISKPSAVRPRSTAISPALLAEQVEAGLAGQPGGELLDRRQAGQVERAAPRVSRPGARRRRSAAAASAVGLVPARHDHPGAAAGQVAGHLPAQAPVGAGHDGDPPGQVGDVTSGPAPRHHAPPFTGPHHVRRRSLAGHSGTRSGHLGGFRPAGVETPPQLPSGGVLVHAFLTRGPGTGGAVCRGWSTGRWPPAWPSRSGRCSAWRASSCHRLRSPPRRPHRPGRRRDQP